MFYIIYMWLQYFLTDDKLVHYKRCKRKRQKQLELYGHWTKYDKLGGTYYDGISFAHRLDINVFIDLASEM